MSRAAWMLAAGLVWCPHADASSAAAGAPVALRADILDAASAPGSVFHDPASAPDPALAEFSARLIDVLRDRLAAAPGSAAGRELRVVVFRLPLVASGDAAFPEPPPAPDATGARCVVSSPWLDLALHDGQTLVLEATALWSERQALHDLAALDALDAAADAPLVAEAPRRPLARSEYTAMAGAWAREAILGEAPPAGAPPLAERLPPDAAWLFAHAPRATRGPFDLGAEGALGRLTPALVDRYIALAGALADRCLDEAGAGGRFGGAKDIRTLAGPAFAEPPASR